MPNFKDLTSERLGRLTMLSGIRQDGDWWWTCACDCGATKAVRSGALTRTSKPTRSCGCLITEAARSNTAARTHGHALRGRRSRTLSIWSGMMDRCYRTKNKKFADYGGRGITVDAHWHENFLTDMGEAPAGLSIDRTNNDLGYSKANCRWATHIEQLRNSRHNRLVEFLGITKPLSAWCEQFGLGYSTTHSRIGKLGWTVDRAFNQPVSA